MKKVYIIVSLLLLTIVNVHGQRAYSMHHMLYSDGEVTLAGKTKGIVTKDELLNAGGLQLKEKFTTGFRISRFKMVVVPKGKSAIKSFNSYNGGELSEEMYDAIKHAKEGDKIYFERIVCTDKNDSLYESDPVAFKLKDLAPVDTEAKSAKSEPLNQEASSTH